MHRLHRRLGMLAVALIAAGCGAGSALPRPTSTPKTAPGWCNAAVEEVRTTDARLARFDATADARELGAVAERLAHEADALDALVRDGAASVLTFAARGDNTFAGFVYLLASRRLAAIPHDRDAFDRAFYVAARHRAYMALHLKAHCEEPLHDREPPAAWVKEATARFEAIRARLEPCRDSVRKASGELPERLELHVRVDERGRAVLVTPTSLDVAPLGFAATDALYCAVKALEGIALPAPPSTLTLAVAIEKNDAGPNVVVLPP